MKDLANEFSREVVEVINANMISSSVHPDDYDKFLSRYEIIGVLESIKGRLIE